MDELRRQSTACGQPGDNPIEHTFDEHTFDEHLFDERVFDEHLFAHPPPSPAQTSGTLAKKPANLEGGGPKISQPLKGGAHAGRQHHPVGHTRHRHVVVVRDGLMASISLAGTTGPPNRGPAWPTLRTLGAQGSNGRFPAMPERGIPPVGFVAGRGTIPISQVGLTKKGASHASECA